MQSSPAVFRVGLGLVLAAALVVQTGLARAQEEQEEKIRETYRARATYSTGFGTRKRLTISIDRWTTDEEHNQLITTLVEKGSEDLLKALQKQEVAGFVVFATPSHPPAIRLRYAREIRVEGKRIIRLATGEPITAYTPFTSDLPDPDIAGDFAVSFLFSLIQLRLDENNEGDGTLCLAVQVKYDKENAKLLVENYSPDRVHLTRVTKTN